MSARSLALTNWPAQLWRVDRVVLALVVLYTGLWFWSPAQAASTLGDTLQSLLGILPFLLASVLVAASVEATGADRLIARVFQGRLAPMILLASLFGALSPFCSCGVIPLIAALLAVGVPLAPVMAFWLASPLMDPSMFVLTVGTLGMTFALAKTAAAVGIGLLGGLGIWWLQRNGGLDNPLRPDVGNGGCGGARAREQKPIFWAFWKDSDRIDVFLKGTQKNLWFLGKWLALAFALESLMMTYVPAEQVVNAVGGDGLWSVVVATLVGVPAYLNGYAALPLVGGLIEQGMAPGAGMAFLLAGGVTSIPAAIAVYALARPPVFAAYLAFAFSGAIVAGWLFGLAS